MVVGWRVVVLRLVVVRGRAEPGCSQGFLLFANFVDKETGCSWYGGVRGKVVVARWLYEVVRGCSWFEEVRSSCGARFVHRRQSAGVRVGAFGCGSVCVEETRAARTRGSPRNQGKSLFYFFSFGFLCVCVS